MNFEEELAKRARARARRNSVQTVLPSPSASTTTFTGTTNTTIVNTEPNPSTPSSSKMSTVVTAPATDSPAISNMSPPTPESTPTTPITTVQVDEMSYEDILAGRDFGSPVNLTPDEHQKNLSPASFNNTSNDDAPDFNNKNNKPPQSSCSPNSSSSDEQPSMSLPSSTTPSIAAPSTVFSYDEDEEDWETGHHQSSPDDKKTSLTQEDQFFRVKNHPSLKNSVDAPVESLPASLVYVERDSSEPETSDEDEEERREELMSHERRRRESTSVKYDAPQQLAVEYILRREEAFSWLKRMLKAAGLHQLSESMLIEPTKLSTGLCNGVVLCEVIRCLRGLSHTAGEGEDNNNNNNNDDNNNNDNNNNTREMIIHRTFPPAMAKMRASDNIKMFLHQCTLLGMPNHSLFQLDDLLDTHGSVDGGNFGMVLYTLGYLARYSVKRQIIKSSLGWLETTNRLTRVFTIEEVTAASVELLMHDGDAGTPILNFTSKKLPVVDRRRGSVIVVRSNKKASTTGHKKSQEEKNQYLGSPKLNKKEFQRRKSIIQGNLVVTRANIGDVINNISNTNNNNGRRGPIKSREAYQVICDEPVVDVPGGIVRTIVGGRRKKNSWGAKRKDFASTSHLLNDEVVKKLKRCSLGQLFSSSPLLKKSANRRPAELDSDNNSSTTLASSPRPSSPSSPSSPPSSITTTNTTTTFSSHDAISSWLTQVVGLPEYISLFHQHGWDDVRLIVDMLNIDEIERMGIMKRGHILRIQKSIPQLLVHYNKQMITNQETKKLTNTLQPESQQSKIIRRTESLVNALDRISKDLLASDLDHSVLSSLTTLVDATQTSVAPGWYSNGSGPPVVVDIGAHETRVELVTPTPKEYNDQSATTTSLVFPSIVGRAFTSYRGFRRLSAPGADFLTTARKDLRKVKEVEEEVEVEVAENGNIEKNTIHVSKSGTNSIVVGHMAEDMAEEYWLRHTLDNDIASHTSSQYKEGNERLHMKDVVEILTHACNRIVSSSSSSLLLECHPVVLIDSSPPLNNKQRADMVTELFDTFGAPSVAVLPHSVCVLAAHGLSTGLVIDIGETSTRVTPVLNGVPLRNLMRRVSVGGKILTERTLLDLVHDGYPFRSFAEPQRFDGYISGKTFLQRRVGQFVKQSLCSVRPAPPTAHDEVVTEQRDKAINESEWPSYLKSFLKRQRQHQFVVWREARAEVTECLFVPHEISSYSCTSGGLRLGDGSIQGLIRSVLSEMSPKVSFYLYLNFLLVR